MSNPDMKVSTVDSLTSGIPIAILFLLITLLLFQFRDSIPSFKIVLWLGFPILSLVIVSVVNMILQYVSCKTTNVGKAILGALPSVGAILIALGVSSVSYCRIPIASVFTPLVVGQTVDITKDKSTVSNINSLKNSKECCIPKLTLESIENRYPTIQGISYGFYMMFSILFSMVLGTGISSIC
jgi:hypothetical protein